MKSDKKIAVITGSAGGLGKEFAQRLLRSGKCIGPNLITFQKTNAIRCWRFWPSKRAFLKADGAKDSFRRELKAGGTKRQTSKLEHAQTNSPSMHFRCENTNSFVIRICHFLTIYLNFCENTNSFLALLKVLFIKGYPLLQNKKWDFKCIFKSGICWKI